MIWIFTILRQCVNFGKKHTLIHDPLPTLGFSHIEECKRLIKRWCNKIIDQ